MQQDLGEISQEIAQAIKDRWNVGESNGEPVSRKEMTKFIREILLQRFPSGTIGSPRLA